MNLPDDRDAVTIARAIIGLAQNLDLHIVAEGIETDEHERFFKGWAVIQGRGICLVDRWGPQNSMNLSPKTKRLCQLPVDRRQADNIPLGS